jgi:hypothetical protein
MSENLTTGSPEKQERLLEAPEHQESLPAHAEAAKITEARQEHLRQLVEARVQAKEHANEHDPMAKLKAVEKAETAAVPQQINHDLRQVTLNRELQYIRRKLSAPQRTLSRVIHQPVVRVVSEAAGKTVSRPSGLLGGGLVALLGTSSYLYMARHIGFTYNYFVFLVLFVGGFAVGLGLELLVHLATTSRRKFDS